MYCTSSRNIDKAIETAKMASGGVEDDTSRCADRTSNACAKKWKNKWKLGGRC